jgi:hypothetical protein
VIPNNQQGIEMKVTKKQGGLLFRLDAESEDDQKFIDMLQLHNGIAYVEDFVRVPSESGLLYLNSGVILDLNSSSPRALRDKAGRKLVYAIRELGGLFLGDATSDGHIAPTLADPDFKK